MNLLDMNFLEMNFLHPEAFLLLLLLPFFWEKIPFLGSLFKKNSNKHNKKNIPVNFIESFKKIPLSFRQITRNFILSALASIALIFFVTALARPQTSSTGVEIEASGRDIMLVLDISRSMQAVDFFIDKKRVNRLDALKKVVNEFISARSGDRIGLVVFGDNAFTQCPLTLDHNILKKFVRDLQIGMAGDGTAIGSALGISLKRLKKIDSESKVAVLVTDGKNNSGKLSPEEAAEIAAKLKVKVYTVGIGSSKPAPFPMSDFFGRKVYRNQIMEFDSKTLKNIAALTKAKYFHAENLKGLEKIYKEIDELEERTEKQKTWTAYHEHFPKFLNYGIVFLLIHLLLSLSYFLKIP